MCNVLFVGDCNKVENVKLLDIETNEISSTEIEISFNKNGLIIAQIMELVLKEPLENSNYSFKTSLTTTKVRHIVLLLTLSETV